MQSPIVADVMSTPVVSVDEETAYKEIIDLLDEHGVSAVPVLDQFGRPVGVVSEMDLIQARRQQNERPSRWSSWRRWRKIGKATGHGCR